MSSATSSSLERARARMRVERNRRRTARQQTSSGQSETTNSSRDVLRGRRVCSRGNSRRKRTPSPALPRKRKLRSPHYNCRSRSSSPGRRHIYCRSYTKFSSFERSRRQRSGSSRRHDQCHCRRVERERPRTKRKERDDSRIRTRYSGRDKRHKRSSSSDDTNSDSKRRTTRKLRQGHQKKREDQSNHRFASHTLGPGVELSVSGISHSAESGELAISFNTQSRRAQKLHTPEDAKLSTLSHQTASSDAIRTDPNSRCRQNFSARNCNVVAPNSQDSQQLKGFRSRETDVNESSDWLNLSLKVPTMPKPNIKGIRREDLQLCLESRAQSFTYSLDGSEEGEIRPRQQERMSCTEPTSANSIGSGPLLKDMMGSNKVSLSNFDTSSTRELNSTGLCALPHVIDDDIYPIMASGQKSFLMRPVSQHLDNVVELSDSSSMHSKNSKDEGVHISPHHEEASHKSGGNVDEVNLCPLGPTTDQVSQQTADQGFLKVMITENKGNVLELCHSLLKQQDVREKRILLLDKQERASMDKSGFVKLDAEMSTEQEIFPTVVNNALPGNQGKSSKLPSRFYPIVELSSDEEGDNHAPASMIQSRSQVRSASKKKVEASKPCPVWNLKAPETRYMLHRSSSTEQLNSVCHQNPVVDPSDLPVNPEDHRDVQAPVEVTQNSPPSPTCRIVSDQCFSPQADVLPPHKPTRKPPHNSPCPQASIELLDLSSDSQSSQTNVFENDVADSVEFRQVLGVKFSKQNELSNRPITVECVEGSNSQNVVHMNDVACCSIKPPPRKSSRVAQVPDKVDNITFVNDKYGNLIQVVEVSDDEEGGHPPVNLAGAEKLVELEKRADNLLTGYSRVDVDDHEHQMQDVLQELQVAFKNDGLNLDCYSDDNQAIKRFPVRCALNKPCLDTSFELPKKSHRSKFRKLVLEESGSNDSDGSRGEDGGDEISTPIEPKYGEMWKHGVRCDLCGIGPSVSFGEWFAWCCGLPASRCQCPEQKKTRKQMAIGFRKAQKTKQRGNKIFVHQWSGRVHKMCALWSSEVFEKESTKKVKYLKLLDAAVKRGNSIICKDADCKKAGATLGCRVKSCRRSYHYPCAEKLASRCLLRMWDCLTIPIACMNHRYVETEVDRAKEKMYPATISFDRDSKLSGSEWQPYLGYNLLCEDISGGQEAIKIPCTNDVDDDLLPKMKYITKCWRKGHSVENLHPAGTKLAKGCSGCVQNFDNPVAPISVHIMGTNGSRESDERLDWQSENMYGRLPYNTFGLLQLGTETKDIVECNSRCKCGPKCKNRELQKGLQVSLELFKTKHCGWGVRSLQQIPRGRFVVEYVGDVLTQAEADEQAEKYDQNQLSYLFNLDHPELGHEDAIVLDGIHMSNIARFINHSCEGNLMVYRVYTETTECKYFRIGMYAIQDIEVGEELSYDYNYAVSKESSDLPVDDPTAIRCCCGAQSCRKWLWRGGNDAQLKH